MQATTPEEMSANFLSYENHKTCTSCAGKFGKALEIQIFKWALFFQLLNFHSLLINFPILLS